MDTTVVAVLVIAGAGVVLFGGPRFAKALPEMSRQVGRATGMFKLGRQEIAREYRNAFGDSPIESPPAPAAARSDPSPR
jgi:Sec-independent protein translocase protein TatA